MGGGEGREGGALDMGSEPPPPRDKLWIRPCQSCSSPGVSRLDLALGRETRSLGLHIGLVDP